MSSYCLFVTNCLSGHAYVIVNVDYLLIFGSEQIILDVTIIMWSLLTVTELGECKYFLGIKIDRTDDGIFLSQIFYTKRVIAASGMVKSKPTRTPLPLAHLLYEAPKPTTDFYKHEMI